MGETTKEERAGWRLDNTNDGVWCGKPHGEFCAVGLSCDDAVRLLTDADRCEELEKDNAFLVDRRMVLSAHYEQHTARITEIEAEVHQRDEWLERAKAAREKDLLLIVNAIRQRDEYAARCADLRGHVERLEAEPRFDCWNCGRLNCKTGVCMDCWHSDNPELDAAKAENERLREGIRDIAERLPGWTDHDGSTPEGELLKLATDGS